MSGLLLPGGLVLLAPVAGAASTGSLWQAETVQQTRLFADRMGSSPGDLVTIIVRLNSTGTRSGSTSTERESSVNEALNLFLFGQRTGATGDRALNFYRSGGETPGFEWGGERSFEGGGSISSREAFTTTLTARITEISASGVVRLEARRVYEAGKERSSLVLSGFVRRDDISLDNSVESSRLADLQIHQEGSGPLSRDQEKGWLTRALETINPF
jgi:flagellar L-ring protein precursor FlgH